MAARGTSATEQPTILLAAILFLGTGGAALLLAVLARLSGAGVVGLGSMVVGVLSACIAFLTEFDSVPLSSLLLVGLASSSTFELARAALDGVRQQRLLRALPLEPVEEGPLLDLARTAGLSALFLVPATRPTAFCFGLWRPRVAISSGLLDRLDDEERAAVLWHESYHARQRQPLRCFVAHLVVRSLFWLPMIADLLDRYRIVEEIGADRVARRKTSTTALTGALSHVGGERMPAAISFADFAVARVGRLFDRSAPLPRLCRTDRLLVSLCAIAALALAFVFPARPILHDEALHLQAIFTTSLQRPPVLIARIAFLGLLTLAVRTYRRRAR